MCMIKKKYRGSLEKVQGGGFYYMKLQGLFSKNAMTKGYGPTQAIESKMDDLD